MVLVAGRTRRREKATVDGATVRRRDGATAKTRRPLRGGGSPEEAR